MNRRIFALLVTALAALILAALPTPPALVVQAGITPTPTPGAGMETATPRPTPTPELEPDVYVFFALVMK